MKRKWFWRNLRGATLCISLGLVIVGTTTVAVAQSEPKCVCAECGVPCGSAHKSGCSSAGGGADTSDASEQRQAQQEEKLRVRAEKARVYNEQGVVAFKQGDFSVAVKLFREAVRLDPANSTYLENWRRTEPLNAERKRRDREEALRASNERKRNAERERLAIAERKKVAEAERRASDQARKSVDDQIGRAKVKLATVVLSKAGLQEIRRQISDRERQIASIQNWLKLYSSALRNNSSEYEKWGDTIDAAFNNALDTSRDYFIGHFIEYNLFGMLERSTVKGVYKDLGAFLGVKDPNIQKWIVDETRRRGVKIEVLHKVVTSVTLSGDFLGVLKGDPHNVKDNLDALLFVNSLFDAIVTNLKRFENTKVAQFLKKYRLADKFAEARVIGETYSDLAAICYGWLSIDRLNTDNNAMAREIKSLSFRMQQSEKELGCLKSCIDKYSAHCQDQCTGKTRLSTPPPPLK